MADYTYKDIIIDPEDPRIEIGAEYYSGDTPADCIALANSDKFDGSDRLIAVDKNRERPFASGSDNESNVLWDVCIIRKKEPKKKYVPFDLSNKEVRDELRGKWIIPKGHSDSIEKQITLFGTQMTEYGKIWCVEMDITPDKLLASWTFIDGTPCGKLVEVDG